MRVGCLAFAALLVTALLPGLAALLVGASTSAATAAGTMDVPTDVLAAIESAAASSGIPWAILAAVASVATDFGRHAPDGRLRGLTEGTIFPVVSPPITGNSAGVGMFLLDPASAPVDPQDVAEEAAALADMIATRAAARPWPAPVDPAEASLSVGAIADFWLKVVTALPLLIPHPAEATTPGDPVPASSGSTDAVNANPIQQFARDLLAALGDQATPQAVGAIAAWAAGEGSCARDNPLDTTEPEPGASPFNTLPGGGHVWNYPSWSEGVEATVATLRNGLYPTVLAALADQPSPVSLEAAVRKSPWGTGRFGPSTYRGAHCPASVLAPPPGEAAANGSGIPGLIVARASSYQAGTTPSGGAGLGGAPTKVASDDIPDQWLVVIRAQADRFAVPWTLVAAVLKETCDFARSPAPGCQWPGSSAVGAGQGYALLEAPVWQRGLTPDSPIPRDGPAAPSGGGFATDGDGDGRADPWSVADATASCARRLAGLGATQPGRAAQAVFAYLHGPAVPVDPADRLTAQTMSWFAAYGGDGGASAAMSYPSIAPGSTNTETGSNGPITTTPPSTSRSRPAPRCTRSPRPRSSPPMRAAATPTAVTTSGFGTPLAPCTPTATAAPCSSRLASTSSPDSSSSDRAGPAMSCRRGRAAPISTSRSTFPADPRRRARSRPCRPGLTAGRSTSRVCRLRVACRGREREGPRSNGIRLPRAGRGCRGGPGCGSHAQSDPNPSRPSPGPSGPAGAGPVGPGAGDRHPAQPDG